jgi:hypothetical protein
MIPLVGFTRIVFQKRINFVNSVAASYLLIFLMEAYRALNVFRVERLCCGRE